MTNVLAVLVGVGFYFLIACSFFQISPFPQSMPGWLVPFFIGMAVGMAVMLLITIIVKPK